MALALVVVAGAGCKLFKQMGSSSPPDIEGYRLEMPLKDAVAACEARGNSHKEVYAIVDASGREARTNPLVGPRPSDLDLMSKHLPRSLPQPPIVAPFLQAMYCNSKEASIELHFGPPAKGGVVTEIFETVNTVPMKSDDYAATLVAHFGKPAGELGPFDINPAAKSFSRAYKWRFPADGDDCAPPATHGTETTFASMLSESGKCATQLTVRVAADPGRIIAASFALSNLSDEADRTDQQNEESRRANPSIPKALSAREMLTPSYEMGCRNMAALGCSEGAGALCPVVLEHTNRTRHINHSKLPLEPLLRQCVYLSESVEGVAACGVSCTPSGASRHSVSSPFKGPGAYAKACTTMARLGCPEASLNEVGVAAPCERALEGTNVGRVNAGCVEAAETPGDVAWCGATCSTARGAAEILDESYDDACSNVAKLGCGVGESKTCPADLRSLAPALRGVRPNPRECLERAKSALEVVACGLPCLRGT